MPSPATDEELLAIHRELLARNGVVDGMIYLQVTRGNPGDRDFVFPDPASTKPTLVLFTQSKPGLADNPQAKVGLKVVSIPDIRWHRRDIKTVQLLYPSMGKMMAKKAGCDDAWFVEDGFVTEGTSNNAYIVKGGKIITRATVERYLCMASPERRCCGSRKRRRWWSRSGRSPSMRRSPRTRLSSPRLRLLSCLWWKLTVPSWVVVCPDGSRRGFGKFIWKKAGRPRFDRVSQ
jgi:hypothetical protein